MSNVDWSFKIADEGNIQSAGLQSFLILDRQIQSRWKNLTTISFLRNEFIKPTKNVIYLCRLFKMISAISFAEQNYFRSFLFYQASHTIIRQILLLRPSKLNQVQLVWLINIVQIESILKQGMAMFQSDAYDFSQQDSPQHHTPLINVMQVVFPLFEKTPQKPEPPKNQEVKANSSQEPQGKTKIILKEKKKTEKKYEKRKRDVSIKSQMGRPDNQGPQGLHLKESKTYNDIVYHFARFLIFLKLKQGEQRTTHAPTLTGEQNKWISKTQSIMAQDNFPSFQDQKPSFLLHSNSPHYVFDYLKKKENKKVYSSQETLFLMIAYLMRKSLLTTAIYTYLCDYWKDIVFLVNNPKGDNIPNNIPQDFEPEISQPQEMMNSQQNNENEGNTENIDLNGRKRKKGKKGPSESEMLRRQLEQDDSIAAYQIACYLHACCTKFQMRITS